jgi:hypothetical protein
MINDYPSIMVMDASRERPHWNSSRSRSMDPNDGTNQNETSLDDELQSESDTNLVADSENIHNSEEEKKTKPKRIVRKKTPDEVRFLENEFAKDPEWTRATVQICKEKLTKLKTAQIYKWGFDKKCAIKAPI